MAFATTHRDEITLAYYCCNLSLAIAFFIIGTIYLRRRDRRDQQRKEWRQFAETIRSGYGNLKAQNILWKISKVKDTFRNINMDTEITGLDVLRYMIDSNRECYKTTPLESLCDDLTSIFKMLNTCTSLILLGTVPHNIRAELGTIVKDLGELILPFYKGKERAAILTCLKHFGSGRKQKVETERRVSDVDARLERDIPYVKHLLFEDMCGRISIPGNRDYNEPRRFHLEVKVFDQPLILRSLHEMQFALEEQTSMSDYARELRELPLNFKFSRQPYSESDESTVVRALHEVRVYIHFLLEKREAIDDEINENIERLKEIYERVTRKSTQDNEPVTEICDDLINDLSFLKKNLHQYNMQQNFDSKLKEIRGDFKRLMRENKLSMRF